MAHDPDVLRGLSDRLEAGLRTWSKENVYRPFLTSSDWLTIIAALRAPQGDGAEAMREAFSAGFWAWAGPANAKEAQRWASDEDAAWQEYQSALDQHSLTKNEGEP